MTPKEALEIQRIMAQKVVCKDDFEAPIQWICGMDVSCNRFDPLQMVYAAAVMFSFPDLECVEEVAAADKQPFPYIPGLLGFREAPILILAFQKLQQKPGLIMVDGHGISHPRGLGIASHLGVLLDVPTIGVAKSILVGKPAASLGAEVGSQMPLLWKGREIGMLYRSKARANPLIISAGHRISLETAITYVTASLRNYRLPVPTREAHLAANRERLRYLNHRSPVNAGSAQKKNWLDQISSGTL